MKNKYFICYFIATLLSVSSLIAQEQLWKGIFEGWEFGFKDGKGKRDDFWKIGTNGELHATGGNDYSGQSGMRTAKTYSDFELTLEYRWDTPGSGDLDGNSGIWIHGENNFDQDNGGYPNSIEVQLKKGEAGDLLRKGLDITSDPNYPNVGSRAEQLPRRFNSNLPYTEYFDGTWNKMTIRSVEGRVLVYLNDRLINEGTVHKNGKQITSGYITLQSELKDLTFKNIYIEELESCYVYPLVYDKNITDNTTRNDDYAEVEIGGFAILHASNELEGTWSWTGPNGFSHEGQGVTVPDVQKDQLGVYTATFAGKNGCNVSHDFEIGLNSKEDTSKIALNNTEVNEADNNKLLITPVPNNGSFTVHFNKRKISDLVIYNTTSQDVYKRSFDKQGVTNLLSISQNFVPGMYILLVTDTNGNQTSTKFVVN